MNEAVAQESAANVRTTTPVHGDCDGSHEDGKAVRAEPAPAAGSGCYCGTAFWKRKSAAKVVVVASVSLLAAAVVGTALGVSLSRAPPHPPTAAAAGPGHSNRTIPVTEQLLKRLRETMPAAFDAEIRGGSETPGGRAYRWLEDHPPISASVEAVAVRRLRERFALASLFYATGGGDSWRQRDGWLDYGRSECTWHGVRCTNGSATTLWPGVRLDLAANGLGGRLPSPAFALMLLWETLKEVNLDDNILTGPIPAEFGNVHALESLFLSGNRFSGSLPSDVGRLSNLHTLTIRDVPTLVGPIPSHLGRLSNLQRLDLSGNGHTGSLPLYAVGLMSKLRFLSLRGNRGLQGRIFPGWGKLTGLEALELGDNLLTGPLPTELGRLANLTLLDVGQNNLTLPLPTDLGLLTRLTSLKLHDNAMSGTIPRELGAATNLQELWLHGNRLIGPIPTELSMLTKLTSLTLHSNLAITGTVPAGLCALLLLDPAVELSVDCDLVTCTCGCVCS